MKAATSLLFILMGISLFAQKIEKPNETLIVAFYNVENLFDTIDSPDTQDEEYLPANGWNSRRYQHKLTQLARVIDTLGGSNAPKFCAPTRKKTMALSLGPDVLGVCEIENRSVLEDLIQTPFLSDENYAIVHEESADPRGIDVGFVYRKNRFQVITHHAFRLFMPDTQLVRTRDVLFVMGTLNENKSHPDTMGFFVCHWPSRRGAEQAARYRAYIAKRMNQITDSLAILYPSATWVMMGDFNDEPSDHSISIALGAMANRDSACAFNAYYNPYFEREKMGDGSYSYQQNWNQLDQIMIKGCFQNANKYQPVGATAAVYRPHWIQSTHERYFGEPYKTFAGKNYLGGFSDHFPIYMIFCK